MFNYFNQAKKSMKRKTEQESLSENEKELKAEPKKKKITREDEIVPELKAHVS